MQTKFNRNIILYILIFFAFAASTFAQNPVKWELESAAKDKQIKADEKLSAKLKAEIEGDWYLYSLEQPAGGPVSTTVSLPEGSQFIIDGDVTTPKPIQKFDPNFEIETKIFKKNAEFNVPLKADKELNGDDLAINIRYQVCNNKLCLPPKTVKVSFDGFEDAGKSAFSDSPDLLANENAASETPVFEVEKSTDEPIWSFIWLALTLGALSLLTPCVFPMIPITVSYFTKNSAGSRAKSLKLATVYSVGIIATFTLLGMLLAFFVGAAGINLFAANPWVNIGIAAIFLFFAFNLFGFYEITVPSGVLNKLDKITRTKEGEGSAYIGALLMGLTFTVTSFTCTSPFVGTILVSTSQGDWQYPLIGMLAFSTVFALPFFVLALAPQLVSQLPKSGGWLNSVKVVMGFLEIAAALKFISNVDLVWSSVYKTSADMLNYGTIFNREVVLVLWVLIAIAIGLYVLGVFKFKLDSPVKKITPLRIIVAVAAFALGVYLTTGILGKKLGEIESFLPPKNAESRLNVLGDKDKELKFIKNDLKKALEIAKQENKKVFVDFTGYTCTNCRWMEANMFPRPEVRREMKKYVLVSLYTDGEGEIYYQQQQFQEKTFQTVALPFYAIMNSDGKPTAAFPGLTRDPQEFIAFLQKSQ
ncbi:MAG: thioredoxin family protein [Acidobacteriota bacterium]|nr:thioredoxin family protein [Acidobacteriota bacterium]